MMLKKIFNKLGIPRTYTVQHNDYSVKIPINKGLGFANLKDAEPWMTATLRKLGSKDIHFIDIGVNVGQTLIKWKSLFPNTKYTGFEPNKACVAYVNTLRQKNGYSNTTVHPYGISEAQKTETLYLLGTDPGDSSATTIANFRKNESRREMTIESIPYHNLVKEAADLIKIDVEGAELGVLTSIFSQPCEAVILCEILPVYDNENKERLSRQEAIEALLKKANYRIYRITKADNPGLEAIETIGIHSNMDHCDYLFIPAEKEANIIRKFN